MMCGPMSRNVDASAHPDAVMALDVVEKTLKCHESAGSSEQTSVHADRHHFRPVRAFRVEHVERVLHVAQKLPSRVEAMRRGEPHVVAIERVRNDQMRNFGAAGHLYVRP